MAQEIRDAAGHLIGYELEHTAQHVDDMCDRTEALEDTEEAVAGYSQSAQSNAQAAAQSAASAASAQAAAAQSASQAQASAAQAAADATATDTAKTAAQTAKTAAETARDRAEAAANTAEGAKTDALNAQAAAETASSTAVTAATNASRSETSASTDASRAEAAAIRAEEAAEEAEEHASAVTSVNGQTGTVVLTKSDLNLGNVDNTSDADKPVSTATQTALNGKLDKSGGTMTGDIAMGSNKITGLSAPTADADAATKKYVDDAIEQGGGGTTIVQIPTVTVGEYTFDGTAQGPTIGSYDSSQIQVTGATNINAGTYTLTLALVNTRKMVWNDLTTADKTYTYTIGKRSITPPTVSGAYTYNGSSQSASISYASGTSGYITQGGNASGTNAGSYTVTFELNDSINTEWSDGTTSQKSGTWSIAKAAPTFSLSVNSVTLNASGRSATATLTYNGDGEVSVSTSDDTVATASLSGGTVTIASVDDTTGTATITVSATEGTNYLAASGTISVTATFVTIYGASWDGTSTTAWTRTDAAAGFADPVPYVSGATSYGSPFDSLQPWAGMTKSERTGGTMVAIPKFWYKLTQTGNAIKVQIADGPVDGYSVSPAHMRRGSETADRDVVYIGRYHCASDYKSETGTAPKANITRSAARSGIHALGSSIWQCDFAMRFTLWLLYIVEFANWNSQAKIGYGCGNNSSVGNMGYTDSMPYHTGTTQTSRTTYGLGTQYRYIEGLWDNVLDWMDGCYYNRSGLNLILNPSGFSDSSGGTLAGLPSNGFPTKFTVTSNGGFPMFYASEANNGSESTYSCDRWNFDASFPCLGAGGYCFQYANYGMFCVLCLGASNASGNVGSRLQELP